MGLIGRVLRRLFGSTVLAAVTLVGAPVAFGATVLAGLVFLPLPATIPLPKANPTVNPTVIYDRYGNPIATLDDFERNIPFTDAQVPEVLKEAVIADEDRNFYHEGGIDLKGIIRAAWADIRNEAAVQGGSTITQQYVKLAYTNGSRTIFRKIREAILASQLAREASKEEILYRYLTIIYLGDGNYGAASAAESYFHVPISGLDASQAATIAGLIPAPSARAPVQHLAQAEAARELVLQKMYSQHYLTFPQYQAALASRLALAGTPGTPKGATIVYPETIVATKYPDFVNYVEDWLQANLAPSVLQEGGLRVQTTLDPAVQNDAYAAVDATLSGSSYPTDMALAAVQPQTGFVEALVGGRGFGGNGPGEQVNLALGGCPPQPPSTAKIYTAASCWSQGMIAGGGGGRQPGSAYKPFTLATALMQGIPLSTTYPAPYVYQIPGCVLAPGQPPSACQIHNDVGDIGVSGYISLATATALSINTVYAQVAEQVGCPNIAATARKLGVETAYYSTPPFYYCASYTLGEVGVSPLDMASAYGVFADHGLRLAPTPILEIVDEQGKVLVDNIHHPPPATQVLPANVADNVTSALEGVIQRGTGTTAQIGRPAAGKTGTTNNTTDAWFVGYTPTLSTAVWMGNENSDGTSLGSVRGCLIGGYCYTVGQVYGATWPATTWTEFMRAALSKVPVTNFDAPAPIAAPTEARALQGPATTTTLPPVEPGSPGFVKPTPTGGPYDYPPAAPVAPPPPQAPPTSPPTTFAAAEPTTTTTSTPSATTTTTTGSGPAG